MAHKRELLHAVEQVEVMLNQSCSLAGDDFLERRKDALALRRMITEQTAAIGKIGETTFDNPDHQSEFKPLFWAARSAMAFHRTSWPIVMIDLENTHYRTSSKSMRQAYEGFIAWVKRIASSP